MVYSAPLFANVALIDVLAFALARSLQPCCACRFLAYVLLSGAVPGLKTGAALLFGLGWGRPGILARLPFSIFNLNLNLNLPLSPLAHPSPLRDHAPHAAPLFPCQRLHLKPV